MLSFIFDIFCDFAVSYLRLLQSSGCFHEVLRLHVCVLAQYAGLSLSACKKQLKCKLDFHSLFTNVLRYIYSGIYVIQTCKLLYMKNSP